MGKSVSKAAPYLRRLLVSSCWMSSGCDSDASVITSRLKPKVRFDKVAQCHHVTLLIHWMNPSERADGAGESSWRRLYVLCCCCSCCFVMGCCSGFIFSVFLPLGLFVHFWVARAAALLLTWWTLSTSTSWTLWLVRRLAPAGPRPLCVIVIRPSEVCGWEKIWDQKCQLFIISLLVYIDASLISSCTSDCS